MNFGERKMQISSEAVPAMRTSPISAVLGATASAAPRAAPRRRPRAPTPRERLDEHGVAGREQLAGSAAAAAAASATRGLSPVERVGHLAPPAARR